MPAARSFRQDTRSEEYRLSRRSKVPRAPDRSFALSASARMRCLYSAVKIRRLALATTWGSGRGKAPESATVLPAAPLRSASLRSAAGKTVGIDAYAWLLFMLISLLALLTNLGYGKCLSYIG